MKDERRGELRVFVTVGLATIVALALLVGVPLWNVNRLNTWTGGATGIEVWGPLLAILISVTSMSVSGIFVFMSFRIDRGVRREARETATDMVNKTVGDVFRGAGTQITKYIEKAKGQVDQRLDEAAGAMEEVRGTVDTMQKKVATHKREVDTSFAHAQDDINKLFEDTVRSVNASFEGVRELTRMLQWEMFIPRLTAEPEHRQVALTWITYVEPPDGLSWEYRTWTPEGVFGDWMPIRPDVLDQPPAALEEPEIKGREWKYVAEHLADNQVYVFVVRAKTPWAGEVSSNEVSVKTPPPPLSNGGAA